MQKRAALIFAVLIFLIGIGFNLPCPAQQELKATISSGGTVQPGFQDIKGEPVIGEGGGLQIGGIYVLTAGVVIPEVPPGTVKLYISRVSNDIKISWEATKYGNNPQIFAMIGDGTGKYSNTYDPATWKVIAQGGTLQNPAGFGTFSSYNVTSGIGSLIHAGQVGGVTGSIAEVYYKGIKEGETVSARLPSAEAVGKVDYLFEQGNTYFNYPFVSSADVNTVFGTSGIPDLCKILNYQKSTDKFSPSTFSTTWLDPFTLELGKGYVFFNYSTSPINLTLVGAVNKTPDTFSSNISTGNNYLGLPFPIIKTLSLAFSSNPVGNDGLLIYQKSTDKFAKQACSNAGAFDNPNFELIMPTGYVYFRYQGSFDWQPRP